MDSLKNLWYKISWEPKEGVVYHNKRNLRMGLVDRGTVTECLFVDGQNEAYACSFMVKKDKNEVEIRIKSDGCKLEGMDDYSFMTKVFPFQEPVDIEPVRSAFKRNPKPPTAGYNPKSRKSIVFKPSELNFKKEQHHCRLPMGEQGHHGKDIRYFFYIVEQKKEGMKT